MGRNRYGEATVLSTISGILFSCATLATDSISMISNLGLPKLSIKIALVFSVMAFRKLSVSFGSTNVVVMPNLGRVTLNRLYVPPYKLLDDTIWSSDLSNVSNAVEIADIPEDVTTAPIPPSRAANLFSSMSLVGLFNRV